MTLGDLRKLTIRKQTTIRFKLRNGMECVITEQGIAQVPALKGIPDFNLETELAAAQEFQIVVPAPAQVKGGKDVAPPRAISRAELAAMTSGGSAAAHAEPDHDEE
jgi:hypothetical protein